MPPPAPISEDDATATPTQSTIDNLARHSENTRRLLSSLEELRDTLESRVNQLATSVQRLREQARELEISMDSHRRAQEQDATWDGPVEATLPEPIPIHTTTSAIATELSTHPRPITAGDINRLLDRASQSLNIAPEGTDQSRESLSRLEPYRNINQAVQANMSELEGTVSSLRRAREGLETGRAAADSAGGGGVAESGSGDTRRSRRISSTRRREMDAEYSRIDAEYRRIRARIQDPVTVPPLNADLPTSTDGILRRDMEARRRLAMIRECAPRNAPMVPSGATPPQGLPATNLGVIRNQKAPIVVRSTAPSPASFAPSSTGALVDGDDEDTRGPLGAGEPTSSDRPQRRARPVRAELLNLRAEMENAQAETQALMDMIQQVDSNQQRSASRPPGTSSTVDTDAAAPVAEQSVQETLRRERVARIRARADQIRGDDPEGTSVEAQAASAPQARRPAFEIAPYGGAAWQARRRWGMHQPDRLSRGEIGSDDDTPSRRRRRNRNAGNANSAGNADSPSDELDGDAATLEVRTDPAIEPAAVMTPPSREQAQVDLLERIQREHQLGTRTLNQTQETALYAYLSNQAQRDARHTMAQAALIRVRAQRPDPQPPASTGPRPVLTHVPGISVTRISLADSRRPEQQGGDRSNGTHAGGLSGAGPARQVDESLTRRGQRVMQAVQGDAPAAPFTAGRARHLAESNAAAQDAGARGLTFDDAQREVIAAREARLRAYERYQAILQASRPLLTPQPGGSGTVSPVRPESVDQENEVLQVRARDDLISAQLRESRAVATREWTRSPLREAGTPIVGRSEPSSSRRDREVTGGIRRTTEITTETMVSLPVGTIGLPRHERSAARVTEADAYPPRDADGTVDLISLTQRMTPEQQDRTTLTHELMQAEERMDLAWAEIVDERNRDADRLERELDTELFTRTETGLPPPRTRQPIPAVQATQPPAGASARTSGPQARRRELRQRLQQSDQLLAAVESRSLSDMQQRRAARDAILAEANSMVSAGTTRSTGVPAERTATDTSGGTSATIAPTETSNPTPASIAAAAAVTATRGTARREDTARQESSPWRNGSASQIPLLGRPITSSEEQPSGVSERQMNEDSPSETAYAPTLRDGETSVRLGQIVVIGSDEEDVSESSAEEDEDDSDEDHSESDDEVILHVPDDTDEAPSSNDSTPNARDHPRVPSPALNPRVLPDRAAYLAARNMSAITSGVNTREATAAPLELEPARSISSMVEEGELGAEGWPTASCPNVRRHRPYVSLLDL